VQDGVLFSGEWQVASGGSILVDAYVDAPVAARSAYLFALEPSSVWCVVEEPRPLGHEGAFLLGGIANYCHWMLDFLPRVEFVASLPPEARIIVNKDLAPYQRETLEMFGVAPERLVTLDYPGVYSFSRLLVPSICSQSGTSPRIMTLQPHVVDWLRRAILPRALPDGPPKADRRLFISRASEAPAARRLINHAEVIDAVSRLGFEVVELQRMGVLEQARLFAEAAIVVGPHGAGMTNMAFAPQGATLIELLGPEWSKRYAPSQFYERVCAIMGNRYARVVGDGLPDQVIDPRRLATEQYRIEPEALLRTLRAAIDSQPAGLSVAHA
jgi:capsular polysaccharide biosynthesis protein